ncbi:PREDICTED: protein C21orf2 homolog isoform X2 [Dinoponera quadriceps]|uniref:Protein C21orf2 homolog isoform X2 n=1 Tax=Dinoponera quadriceps TaxID=609295 RepID=A0A6P3XDQ6_DINQU|nr:PREDICTED: protein C21orf2 homolog isoform X2 [Dinoponera quadriceps]
MVKLTEEMIVARTRMSDFSAVMKLNCWGTELTDVSILRKMKNVEVLSLSINNINTLADFQYCHKLQDLFVRRNNIKDLNEICYLQGLPKLRNLWLGENPCAEKEGYRLAVLRALPNLEKLDDKEVSPEEVQTAMTIGRPLVHPLEMDTSPQSDARSFDETQHSHEEYDPDRRNANYSASSSHHYSQNNQYAYELQNGQSKKQSKDDTVRTESRSNNETATTNTLEISKDYDDRPVVSRHNGDYDERRGYSDYGGNETSQRVYTSTPQHRTPFAVNEPVDDRRNERNNYDYDERIKLEYEDSQSQVPPQTRRVAVHHNVEREDTSQMPGWVRHTDKDKCRSQFHYHRRPVTRNSNILSAVLCLVKELDYPSLEVVEMAVRNRMDELEE